jgi:hypothetical protein
MPDMARAVRIRPGDGEKNMFGHWLDLHLLCHTNCFIWHSG